MACDVNTPGKAVQRGEKVLQNVKSEVHWFCPGHKKLVTSCLVTPCHWELESNWSCLQFQVSCGVCLGGEVHMTGWSFWRRLCWSSSSFLEINNCRDSQAAAVCQQRSAAWQSTALLHYVYATTGISIYSKWLLFTSLTLNIWYPLWILMDCCTVLCFLACHLICLYSDRLMNYWVMWGTVWYVTTTCFIK